MRISFKNIFIIFAFLFTALIFKVHVVNAYPINCQEVFPNEVTQCSDSAEGGSCSLRCWHDVNLNHDFYSCDPHCPSSHPRSTGHDTTAPPGYYDMIAASCSFCGNYVNCWAPIPPATPTVVQPTPTTPQPTPTIDWCNNCGTHPQYCLQYNCGNACNANGVCYYAGNPTPTPDICRTCSDANYCIAHGCGNACGTNGCYTAGPTSTPAPSVTPRPPTGECTPGGEPDQQGNPSNPGATSCSCSGGGAGHCDQCNGGWCYGYTSGPACRTCRENQPPPPPPPPPPRSPTPTRTPTPTPIQQPTTIVTAGPTPTVNPAVPTPTGSQNAQLSQRWVCLDAKPCISGVCSGQGQVDHRALISSKTNDAKPLPGADTYVFECLRVPDPQHPGRTIQKCTTGDPTIDQSTVGVANYEYLKGNNGYRFSGMYKSDGVTHAANPVPRANNNNGDIGKYEWESYTTTQINRTFFAMNWYDPNGPQAGNDFTQKQGTLTFDEKSKKCVMIRWDPRGTIFDSRTLKPIAGAEVTLLKKLDSGKFVPVTDADVIGGGLENPYITKDDGIFNFYVPEGTYKIMVKKDGYTYKSSYYGQEFLEQGKIDNFDILLDPNLSQSIIQQINTLLHQVASSL